MKKDIKSISYEICVDTNETKEKIDEIKKIIDSIDFHFKGLKKAVNDLENYNSKFEIKYSLDACSSKSCQVSKDEWFNGGFMKFDSNIIDLECNVFVESKDEEFDIQKEFINFKRILRKRTGKDIKFNIVFLNKDSGEFSVLKSR